MEQKRLVATAVKIMKRRQQIGFDKMRQVALRRRTTSEGETEHSVYSHAHLWDEVELKFRWKPKYGRVRRKAILCQTMVQRGYILVRVLDKTSGQSLSQNETWLVEAKEVEGTKPENILPAVQQGIPSEIDFDQPEKLTQLMEQFDACAFIRSKSVSVCRIVLNSSETYAWGNSKAVGCEICVVENTESNCVTDNESTPNDMVFHDFQPACKSNAYVCSLFVQLPF